jgi:NhaP-type Na+/H+ or K+/H+ antiporter
MAGNVALCVLCIVVGGIAAQWLAWRTRLPAIVLLFAIGLVVGPGLQILQPEEMFGADIQPVIGLAVAIVVFEGGLGLNFSELRAAGEGVLRLTALALPISFLLSAMAAKAILGFDWGVALLFGAITVVTGPTVVLPLLRHVRLERRASSFLKWEAIVNDPIGALLAAIVLSVVVTRSHGEAAFIPLQLAGGLAVAAGLGVGASLLVRWLFIRDQAPEILKTPIVLALALGVYAASNVVMDEAGLAAATIFGIALANLKIPGISELARFKESLVVLLVSALFIVLTASLPRELIAHVSWPIFFLTLAMLMVVRPIAILLATIRTSLDWRERTLCAWIAPRGIVAAAVAGVASAKMTDAGYHGGDLIMPAVFALIAATMVLHGFSLGPLARRLGLTLGEKQTLAIVGASPWAVQLAETLHAAGIPVLLVDTFPGALASARRSGIPVLQAELVSEHGEHALEDQRIDYLLSATSDDVYNSLVCTRLAPELGRGRVFQLGPDDGRLDHWAGLSRDWRGRVVGTPSLSFEGIERRFAEGWRFTAIECEGDGSTTDTTGDVLMIVRRHGPMHIASEESEAVAGQHRDWLIVFGNPSERADPIIDRHGGNTSALN